MEYLRVATLREEGIIPSRKNPTDAGIDFYTPKDFTLEPNSMQIIATGVTVEIPEGYMLLIKPKGKNHHLVGAGVGDAFYHPGEIFIKVINATDEGLFYKRGDGIGQGVLIPVATPELVIVDEEDLKNISSRSEKGGIVGQQIALFSSNFESVGDDE